jgi:iron(III) transport system permease protein
MAMRDALLRRFGTGLAALATILVVALILAPIVTVLISSFWSAPFLQLHGHFTGANFSRILSNPRTFDLLRNTGIYTIGAASIAVFLGSSLAWIATRVRLPFARVLGILPVMPLFLPALLKDTSWIQLFSPRTGLVNLGLMQLFGWSAPPFNVFSLTGMIANAGLSLAPIAYLMLLGPMSSLDRALEEASFASGASLWRTVFHVTLPAVMPGIISAFALISIIVACSFETPIIIGLPGGISTYMSTIYKSMSGGASPNFSMASAQAVIYLAMIGVLLAWYLWATRREAKYALIANRGGSSGRIDVGGWRYVLAGFVVLYWIASFGAFLLIAVLISLIPFYTVTGGNPFQNFSLDNYRAVFADGAVSAVWGSITLALVVSIVAVVVALLLAMVSLRTKWRLRRLADAAGTVPIGIPPLVFSVALLITVLSVPGLKLLYNSWAPMILASVVAFLPFALRTVSSGLIAIPRSMEEASASCGAGASRTLFFVTLPILTSSLISAALLVFVYSLRELAAVALLVRPGTALLPTQIFQYLQVGQFNLANTLNVISIGIAAGVVAILVLLQRTAQGILGVRQRRKSAPEPFAWQQGGETMGVAVRG